MYYYNVPSWYYSVVVSNQMVAKGTVLGVFSLSAGLVSCSLSQINDGLKLAGY